MRRELEREVERTENEATTAADALQRQEDALAKARRDAASHQPGVAHRAHDQREVALAHEVRTLELQLVERTDTLERLRSGKASSSIDSAELRSLSQADLLEVRALSKPPGPVRRSLELVRAMLRAASGAGVGDRGCGSAGAASIAGGGNSTGGNSIPTRVDWDELKAMTSRSDFIPRVLQLKPSRLADQPGLLAELLRRWPALLEAEVVDAAPGPTRNVATATARDAARELAPGELQRRQQRQASGQLQPTNSRSATPAAKVKAAAKPTRSLTGARATATSARKPSSAPDAPLRRAALHRPSGHGATTRPLASGGAGGAAAPASLSQQTVTYSSKACGALYRHCGSVMRIAVQEERLRRELAAEVAELLSRMGKLRAEEAALAAQRSEVVEAERAVSMRLSRCQEVVGAERDELERRRATHDAAQTALEAARTRLAEFEAAEAAAEAERVAQREREERRRARARARLEQQAQASAQVERALRASEATRPAWLRREPLPAAWRPVEFAPFSSTLTQQAQLAVAHMARALCGCEELHVHLSGHCAGNENSDVASARAQAVGAALIAAGVAPSRLRAKGYGSTVPLTSQQRVRLRIRSDRRVAAHAIGMIVTREPISFAPSSTALEGGAVTMVRGVAALLKQHSSLKVSVEGHIDGEEALAEGLGREQGGADLAQLRAKAVSLALQDLGTAAARLVPHSFGALLSLGDNESDAGRALNRRVQLLVIPDVGDAAGVEATAARASGARL